jgi:haloalkane dehalogenase
MPSSPWLDRTAYPFRSQYAALSAGRVHYVDEGPTPSSPDAGPAGCPVLLVHGTPSWSFEYRHLIRSLSATRRVIAFDHLGFGLSDRPGGFGYRPEDHARVFAELVEVLGLQRFTLVVHDFGGPIALPFAVAHPERVARLVVLNSFMWPFEESKLVQQARFAGSAFGRFLYCYLNFSLRVLMPFAYGDKRRLTPAVHAQYLAPFRERSARVQVLWALARSLLGSAAHYAELWQHRARLAAIPALVLWGAKDRALPASYADRWREALPHAHVERLTDAGHWPQEEVPERVSAVLRAFV